MKLKGSRMEFADKVWQLNDELTDEVINEGIEEMAEAVMEARTIIEALLVDRDKTVEDFEGNFVDLVYSLGDANNLLSSITFEGE